jgi:collagenase-like PrtC family protease
MKLTVPINWQDDFFDKVDLSSVCEVYGKLDSDVIGGGRASVIFPKVALSTFKDHVSRVRALGLDFNYLLNASCMDNMEFSRDGSRKIRKFLDFLFENKVNMVTITLPSLVSLVKKFYPSIKVSVSTNAMVNSYDKLRCWEEFGIDQITLSYSELNRDFKELRRIVKYKKCEVQLICNLFCRKDCPFQAFHSNFHSHASQKGHVNKRFPADYYCMFCLVRVWSNPFEIMRSCWIRPEDVELYEKIGIEKFKLAERGMNTPDLSRIVKAYTERSYAGNLMDLIPTMSKYRYISDLKVSHFMKYFFRPSKISIPKLIRLMEILQKLRKNKDYYFNLGIYMDNKKLDGFMERFVNSSCRDTTCDECGYCLRFSEKAIKVLDSDPGKNEDPKALLKEIVDTLAYGEL